MYIIANLPAMYGRFQQIKKENYPFKRAFGQYLEALSRLGLALEAEPDRLSGIVEDALFPGEPGAGPAGGGWGGQFPV